MPFESMKFLEEFLGGIAFFSFFVIATYLLASALRRRQQNAMQRHLLEKFSSAKDFADFVQSPAGQRYVMGFTDAVTSPRNSILTSMQTGLVLIGLGAGMASGHLEGNIANDLLHSGANISICVGLAFLASSVLSYFLARKVGSEGKE
ncbi:MAG TPA: hypothetical protein VKL40_00550 [Candidatus Angelobacter sp.]|nr:hypothetical protein [Candidatus Angelobacter sp.]